MTQLERDIAEALGHCSFLPGTFDKKFVHQLDKWADREMTEKGRAMMLKLLDKYRRQIPNFEKLKALSSFVEPKGSVNLFAAGSKEFKHPITGAVTATPNS